MSHHLNRHLSEEFGRSVYFKRPVTLIMDSWPLIVEASTPVELTARQALLRNKQNIFDYVIVTECGRFKGVVSVQKILDTLAEVQVEMAKGASPLTGLPGNLLIEQEIERRAAGSEPFAIVYADLDNFKVYNDIYGFVRGDDIILLLGRIMAWAIKRHGGKGDFLGHVGGDDFVALTSPCLAERICRSVVRVFGRLVVRHFTPEDLARGFVRGKDRRGQEMSFPLTSVSLGILECAPGTDLLAIAQSSSATKTFAKTIPGNSYVYDRRNPKASAMAEACRLEEPGDTQGRPRLFADDAPPDRSSVST
jgi:GGDEF domain-containing protein